MLVDLIQTTTRDGFRLDGAFLPPTVPAAAPLPVDAFCLVHGTGGSFYTSALFDDLSERLRALGCGVLRVNTRGHGLLSMAQTSQGGLRQGAAYEIVDHCRHDIAAWVGWLRQRVGPRIGLLGHSLGAIKCLYAQAQEPDDAVVCLAAVSPPRLSYSWFCTSPEKADFLETYQRAEQHAANGQAGTLLEVKLPLPMLITADGYLEKYGPEERYNYLRFLAGIRCPILVTVGSVEVAQNLAFRGAPQALQEQAARHKHLTVETIAGADHFYNGTREVLGARLAAWLGQMAGSRDPAS
jgi:pimeloyl-ACP methyl ester carboxylesterase